MRSLKSMCNWCAKAIQVLGGTLVILLLSLPAFSQGNTGRILGTVTDQSGGVVAGATVTVIDTERGVTRTLTSDDAGEYNAPNLTPSNYTVRAEAKGFKKLERQNVALEVGKEVRVDLTVQPGASEQTVTVTEAVPLVETTTATLGGTLENSEIADLPLNGRDYQNLLALRPGIMLQVGGGPWTQSTNGVRPDQSVWLVDGVINSNFYDGRPIAGMPSPITDGATILPIDSIQEFNLMENPKAEYGWKAGAVVNVGIKSGTNMFHGSAYGFYRAAAWDARNYFDFAPSANGSCIIPGPAAQCDKAPTQLKQFGGSVGGPIKKDKLFFFANYEGLRDLIGNAFGTTNGTGVPETVSQANVGAFGAAGDTANSMVDALWAAHLAGTVSPTTLALTGCTLGGTQATTACTGGFFPSNPSSGVGYLSTFPNVNNSDNGVGKIDYHVNDKNTVNGDFIIGRYFGDGEDRGFNNKLFLNNYTINTWTASGNWDYTPNSSMVNEVRFGYNRMTFLTGSDDANLKVCSSLPATNCDPVNTGATVPGIPVIIVKPFGQLGTWHNRPNTNTPNPYWDVQESLSYLAGKHSLKFGGEYTNIEADTNTQDYGRGRINFPNLISFFEGAPTPGPSKAGQFFVGNADRHMKWSNIAAFVQDDWRLSPKFTLNLGLRYEYKSSIREANNLWANFDPTSATGLVQQGQPGHNTLWNPDKGNFSPRVGFAWDINGKGTTVVRGGASIMYETFTAVEFMSQLSFQNSSGVALANNPTGAFIDDGLGCMSTVPISCRTLGGNIAVKAANFTDSQLHWDGPGTVFPSNVSLSCSAANKCNLMAVDPNLKAPEVYNYSLGVTHAFSNDLSLEVGYVGDHGSRLTVFNDVNKCAPNVGKCVLPYANQFPYLGFINEMTNSARSNYNSAQVTLTKRMSHGVSFIAGYTYAHGLDSGSLNRFGLLAQNPSNPGAEYGNSDFDVRHRLTFTGTYNIPGIKGFGQVLEGWQLNSILTVQSAQPWTINDYGNDFSGTQGTGSHGQDRWDFFGNTSDFKGTQNSIPYCTGPGNGGCSSVTGISLITECGNGVGTGTGGACDAATSAAMWAKCTAVAPDPITLAAGGCFVSGSSVMTPPKAGTFGTMGRNIFRDSGYWNLDFSVFKNFKFKERYGVQLRAEIFNILNHPVYENPYGASNGSTGTNNDPSSPAGFGAAIGTPDVVAGNPVVGSGDSRAVQVGLKLTF
jgi:hypothetical protein